jgi:hypothetical protein
MKVKEGDEDQDNGGEKLVLEDRWMRIRGWVGLTGMAQKDIVRRCKSTAMRSHDTAVILSLSTPVVPIALLSLTYTRCKTVTSQAPDIFNNDNTWQQVPESHLYTFIHHASLFITFPSRVSLRTAARTIKGFGAA